MNRLPSPVADINEARFHHPLAPSKWPGMVRIAPAALFLAVIAALVPGGGSVRAEPSQSAEATLVRGNNAFACDLYAGLKEGAGNVFFSPYGISTALAMTAAGARGNTEKQFAGVLRFGTEPAFFHEAFGALNAKMKGPVEKTGFDLKVANALWVRKARPVLSSYPSFIEKHYSAEVSEIDFAGDPEAARNKINGWVERNTGGKIGNLLPPGSPDRNAAMVLTNAIYFKGNWTTRFDSGKTRPAPFHLLNNRQATVPMMNLTGRFKFLAGEKFRMLELPYADCTLSLVVILPTEKGGIIETEKNLTGDNLSAWLKELEEREVRVALPKFILKHRLSLAGTLKSMGLTDAFSAPPADFSGIDGGRDLFINDVIHEAYLDVNEQGSEAAAATAAVANMATSLSRTEEFVADHPFIFLIRDTASNGILFLGRLVDPGN